MDYRYIAEIYSGKVYCGNGHFNTLDECYKFALDDGFCDKMIVFDSEAEKKLVVKF